MDQVKNKIDGVVIGVIISRTSDGVPMVAFSANHSDAPVEAKTTIALGPETIGCEVALLFEGGDVQKPMVIGLIHHPDVSQPNELKTQSLSESICLPEAPAELLVDGKSTKVFGENEIVLKCGKASITLTRAGKVIIRGAYISTRSSGANRIKGGSVQIN